MRNGPWKAGVSRPRSPYSFIGLGFEIAVPVALCMFVGYRLDRWLSTEPWLLLVGAFVGISVGFYGFFRAVQPRNDDGGERGR
jgi:F0F1-type ATP synthase assembly protein I